MKALSVRQPWAALIAVGEKTVEIRSRPWSYRGPLVICATARPSPEVWFEEPDGRRLSLPCGVAVGLVDLVDCHRLTVRDADAACMSRFGLTLTSADCRGQWAWVFANAREVQPLPVNGQLQPWDWKGPELVPTPPEKRPIT